MLQWETDGEKHSTEKYELDEWIYQDMIPNKLQPVKFYTCNQQPEKGRKIL